MQSDYIQARDRAASKKAAYLAALFAFFFPLDFLGSGGAFSMRRIASSKGMGTLCGLVVMRGDLHE